MAVSHVYSNTNADATGTLTIWNGATTSTVAASALVKPSDWNSAHNQFVTVSGNTTGQSTFSGTNVVYAGSNNITLSGANATLINIIAPPAASAFLPYDNAIHVVAAQSNQSVLLAPKVLQWPASWDRMVMPFQFSQATNSTMTVSNSIHWGFYTRNGDTLSLLRSNSGSFSINGSGTASSSANSGIRIVSFGDTTGLPVGNYVIGFMWRSSTAGVNASLSNLVASQINSTMSGYIGSASVTNRGLYHGGLGVWTSTTSGPLPNSIAMTDVRQNSSAFLRPPVMYFTSGTV